MKKILICGFALMVLSACGYSEVTKTADNRPSIIVRNAPFESTFSIDGIDIGKISDVESVRVEPGKHVVKVYSPEGGLLHTEKVYVSGSVLREITLPEKNK